MAQHRMTNSPGQDTAVYLHLKDKRHSFKDNNIHILDREDRWFGKGSEGGNLCQNRETISQQGRRSTAPLIPPTYNTVLSFLPTTFNKRSNLASCDCSLHWASGDSNNSNNCCQNQSGVLTNQVVSMTLITTPQGLNTWDFPPVN